jgi:hypothetical protein
VEQPECIAKFKEQFKEHVDKAMEQAGMPGIFDRCLAREKDEKKDVFDAVENDETKTREERDEEMRVLRELMILEELDKIGMLESAEAGMRRNIAIMEDSSYEWKEEYLDRHKKSFEILDLYKAGRRA